MFLKIFPIVLCFVALGCEFKELEEAQSSPIYNFTVDYGKTDSLIVGDTVTLRLTATTDNTYWVDSAGFLEFFLVNESGQLLDASYLFVKGSMSDTIEYGKTYEYRVVFLKPGEYRLSAIVKNRDAGRSNLLYDLKETHKEVQQLVSVKAQRFTYRHLSSRLAYGKWMPFIIHYQQTNDELVTTSIDVGSDAELITTDSTPISKDTVFQVSANRWDTFLLRLNHYNDLDEYKLSYDISGYKAEVLFSDIERGEESWFSYIERDTSSYRSGHPFTPSFHVDKNAAKGQLEIKYDEIDGAYFLNGEYGKWLPYVEDRDSFASRSNGDYLLHAKVRSTSVSKEMEMEEFIEVIPHTFTAKNMSFPSKQFTFTLGVSIEENYRYGAYQIVIDFAPSSQIAPYVDTIEGTSFSKEFTYGGNSQSADYHIQIKHLETGMVHNLPFDKEREHITRLIEISSTTFEEADLLIPAFKPSAELATFSIKTNGAVEDHIAYYLLSNHDLTIDRGTILKAHETHLIPTKEETIYIPSMYNRNFYLDVSIIAKDTRTGEVIDEKVIFDNKKVWLKTAEDFLRLKEIEVSGAEKLLLANYDDEDEPERTYTYTANTYLSKGPPLGATVTSSDLVCIQLRTTFSLPTYLTGLTDRKDYIPTRSDINYYIFPNSVKVTFELYSKLYHMDLPLDTVRIDKNSEGQCPSYVDKTPWY